MAQEYFVNEPEYREIMRMLTELGGVDLDQLLQRMTAVENSLGTLGTRLDVAEGDIDSLTNDIGGINDDISDIRTAETARNTWHNVLAWGNYHTVGQTLNLTDTIADYDFLCVIAGYSSDPSKSGYGTLYLPTGFATSGTVFTVSYEVNGTSESVTAQFTDATHLKILRASENNLGIRIIIGRKK